MPPDCLSGAFLAVFQSRVNQLAFGLVAILVKYSCCNPGGEKLMSTLASGKCSSCPPRFPTGN